MLDQNKKQKYILIFLYGLLIVEIGLLLFRFDYDILFFIRNYIRNDFLNVAVPFYTSLGEDGIIWIALGVLMLIPKKTRKCGIMVLAALLVMLVVNNIILKNLIARPRPCAGDYAVFVDGLVKVPSSFSFPSGHTTSAFAVAFTINSQHKKLGKVILVMAAIMAFTRLYVFVHFPTDIYGGIVVAAGIAYFVYKMEKILTPKIMSLLKKKA